MCIRDRIPVPARQVVPGVLLYHESRTHRSLETRVAQYEMILKQNLIPMQDDPENGDVYKRQILAAVVRQPDQQISQLIAQISQDGVREEIFL